MHKSFSLPLGKDCSSFILKVDISSLCLFLQLFSRFKSKQNTCPEPPAEYATLPAKVIMIIIIEYIACLPCVVVAIVVVDVVAIVVVDGTRTGKEKQALHSFLM